MDRALWEQPCPPCDLPSAARLTLAFLQEWSAWAAGDAENRDNGKSMFADGKPGCFRRYTGLCDAAWIWAFDNHPDMLRTVGGEIRDTMRRMWVANGMDPEYPWGSNEFLRDQRDMTMHRNGYRRTWVYGAIERLQKAIQHDDD